METLPDLAMWSALVGIGMPNAVAVVNQPRWRPWVRALVTAVLCAVAAGVTAELSGALTGRRWLTSALIVATLAVGSYQKYWKPSGITPAIEAKTSPGTDHSAGARALHRTP